MKIKSVDFPFLIMGFLCILSAIGEYLYPVEPRSIPRAIYGSQIIFGLVCVVIAIISKAVRGSQIHLHLSHPIPIVFTVFFLWIQGVGFALSEMPSEMTRYGKICLFWYSMFLFFYVVIQVYPNGFRFFPPLLFVATFIHFFALKESIIASNVYYGRTIENYFQNYASYNMVVLFPFLLFLKHALAKVIAAGLIALGCLYSFKRGSSLMFISMVAVALWIDMAIVHTGRSRMRSVFVALCLCGFIAAITYIFYSHNRDRINARLQIGTGSGRLERYKFGIQTLSTFNMEELFWGRGSDSFSRSYGGQPHNDMLLLMHDYGLFSELLMLTIYFVVARFLYWLYKTRSPLSVHISAALIGIVCMQMYSYGVFETNFGYLTGAIGLVSGAIVARPTKEMPPCS